jgi:outer membrane protein assembly factor BamB
VNRRRLVIAGAVALALGVAIGVWAYNENQPTEKRGSAKDEFIPAEEPKPRPRPEDPTPWPTYAANFARTGVSPFSHRPPFRRLWTFDAREAIEFPPSVGYGALYFGQQLGGRFFAIDARTGRVKWRKNTGRCSAASPTVANGVVYMSWMDHECPTTYHPPDADGYLVAWDAKTGRRKWIYRAGPLESSPLLVRGVLYVAGWDHKIHAVDAKTGRRRWAFTADEEVTSSGAHRRGIVYFGTDGGTVYALDARTGRQRWAAHSNARFGNREFFYATPTVAYGRVYIGNTDGTMYVYGARSGRLLWARPLGTYIYAKAAVYRRRVYVGTYDGQFYALDAATGDVKWQRPAGGLVHSPAAVMGRRVYYSICERCGQDAQRSVAQGLSRTYALDARTGRRLWSVRAGKYASPIVADRERTYLIGQRRVIALRERGRGARARRAARP